MKVVCDSCSKEFIMKQEMLRERYLGSMITETFYYCPKCRKKYLVCIINAKCRRLKREIKEKSLQRFNDTEDIESVLLDKDLELTQQKLKIEINKINGR